MTDQLTLDLPEPVVGPAVEPLAPGAMVLRGFALSHAGAVLADVERVAAAAPFRHLVTPGGFRMSVAMTNCGTLGWVSDTTGYRYSELDPDTGRRWPAMPASLLRLASAASERAGFGPLRPEACLVNRYAPGARLTLHQDRDELELSAPIVSVSLGLPAVFLLGGLTRKERPQPVPVRHGDVVVWGGPSRLRFHGVRVLPEGHHPATGRCRINLTFRTVLGLRARS
ncbi:DNA oxidative demethylase AlkB [Paraliomyxa miuraensis]|uniref:DNA oxidative demethylase AlkB n=1 Tax=Paraliomyxa miuraensis TaxID=376150 RepID=UPI0022544CEA|nr:DNA oxidative demethylase AlkB [Paraliomyxa miuraensis]MCX4241983.1 DNA oxidative demethylase AlkB [Paraliomyxa miuraensis]